MQSNACHIIRCHINLQVAPLMILVSTDVLKIGPFSETLKKFKSGFHVIFSLMVF